MTADPAARVFTEALRLAAAGYQLTPVTIRRREDGKKGATFHADDGWRHESAWTTDPDQLKAWCFEHPACSFAVRTGAVGGVDVVDLDVKGDVDAVTWWATQGHPLTAMIVSTPSGGMHLYARACGLPTAAGVFAPGVDTRGDGGLVFAPGAYVLGEDGHYEVQGPLVPAVELAPLPADLAHAIRSAAPAGRDYRADGEIVVKDRAVIVNLCRERVIALAGLPPRTGGSHFRDVQMGAAMMLGRLVEAGAAEHAWAVEQLERATVTVWGSVSGADADNIASGLRDGPRKERWRFRPDPPAPSAGPGLQRATVPAAADATTLHAAVSPPALRAVGEGDGYDHAAAQERMFADKVRAEQERRAVKRAVDELERPPVPVFDDLAVWDDALESLPAPTMAIRRLVPERSVGWLGGPSGSYKSFVAVSLAACLAYGVPALEAAAFAPRSARRVLYVAGEGASGVALRLRALRHRLGVRTSGQLALYPRAVDLTSEAAVERMAAFALAYHIGHIVIDTFRQSTLGVNENDNTEVGLILGRLIELRDAHGISSTLVDHTNKSAQGLADLGGAGAKRANADYVLMVDLPNGSRAVGEQRVLRVAKLKDSPDGDTWPIRLESVAGVTDSEGCPAAVVVVGEVQSGPGDLHGREDWHKVPTEELPEVVRDIGGAHKYAGTVQDIYRALVAVNDPDGLTVAQLRSILDDGPREHPRTSFYGAIGVLKKVGLVPEEKGRIRLLDAT